MSKNSVNRRVGITGIGVLSPIGTGSTAFWRGMLEGKAGIEPVTLFDTSKAGSHRAAEVKGFDPAQFVERKGLQYLNRSITLGCAAAKLALEDAEITVSDENRSRIGVVYGTTLSCLNMMARFDQQSLLEGPRSVNPMNFPNTGVSAPACQVSIMFGMDAFNTTLSNGPTSSLDAVKYAVDFIRLGRADLVLAGGVEELCVETFLAHALAGLLSGSSPSEEEICAPFDRRRNGIVLGEGSAVLVLEQYEQARRRGAPIYAEVGGYGSAFTPVASNGHCSQTRGAIAAMQGALNDARIDPSQIDLVCANANSSYAGDLMEAKALDQAFSIGQKPHITAIKSMIGESYSAAGALQVSAAALALRYQAIPPTINYGEPDTECPLDTIVRASQQTELRNILINAFGCNGNNASLLLTRSN
jgi:3-oxoacyl-[acyl-carrier-protein] synthase II